jgi:peroxiredoxin
MVGASIVLGTVALLGTPPLQGHLDSGLHNRTRWVVQLTHVTASITPAADEYRGEIRISPKVFFRTGGAAAVALVKLRGRETQLYADLNRDGFIAQDERIPALADSAPQRWVIRFRFGDAPSGHWPVLATLSSDQGTTCSLVLDAEPYVTGRFRLSEKTIEVRLPYDLRAMNVDARVGYLGMDTDGNGSIALDPLGPEMTYAMNEDVVFRVLDRFVSVRSADADSGMLLLDEHPPSDYQRMELTVGATAPDFAFETLDGVSRHLSDYRGRYVLLFIWDTGCFFAREEIPAVRQALAEFESRGFQVLGFSADDDEVKAAAFIDKQEMRWPQAVGQSARDFVHKRARAVGLPTMILLDPNGRVLSRNASGEPEIRGDELRATLRRLFGSP